MLLDEIPPDDLRAHWRTHSGRPDLHGDGAPGVMLLDLEGTLVDTPFLQQGAWCHALEEAGVRVPSAEAHHAVAVDHRGVLNRLLGAGDATIERSFEQAFAGVRVEDEVGRDPKLVTALADVAASEGLTDLSDLPPRRLQELETSFRTCKTLDAGRDVRTCGLGDRAAAWELHRCRRHAWDRDAGR